jgi:hypothetical protein
MAAQTNSGSPDRCQHKSCVCNVAAGKQYCSDFCEKASSPMANLDVQVQVEPCKCGHPDCGTWEEKGQRIKNQL